MDRIRETGKSASTRVTMKFGEEKKRFRRLIGSYQYTMPAQEVAWAVEVGYRNQIKHTHKWYDGLSNSMQLQNTITWYTMHILNLWERIYRSAWNRGETLGSNSNKGISCDRTSW